MQSQQEILNTIMAKCLIQNACLYAKRQDKFTSKNRLPVFRFRGMPLSYNLLKVR